MAKIPVLKISGGSIRTRISWEAGHISGKFGNASTLRIRLIFDTINRVAEMKHFVIVCLVFLVILQGTGIAAAQDQPDYSKIVIVNLNISKSGFTRNLLKCVMVTLDTGTPGRGFQGLC